METRVEKPRRHKWIAAALALIMTMTVFLTALPPLPVGAAGSLKNVIFMFNDIVSFYSDPSDDENVILESESSVSTWNGKTASVANNEAPEGKKLTFSAGVPTYLKFSAEINPKQMEQVVFEVYALSGTEKGERLGECQSDPSIANGYRWNALTETHETIIIVPSIPAAKHTVTLPPSTRDYMFKAVNGTEVEEGKDFQFYLYKRQGMGEREVNFTILESFVTSYTVEQDNTLSLSTTHSSNYSDGIGYVVKNVREDITIDFSATDEKFTATLDSGACPGFEGSTVAKETSITSGANFPFNITIKPGYGAPTVMVKRGETGSEETLVATGEGGNSVTGTIYFYTVQNVTTNITIKVTGDPIANYPVRWADGTEYSFTEKYKGDIREDDTGSWDSVDYGTQVKFQIQMSDGYDPNQVVVLVNGNETSKGADGYYHFTVTGDTGISIRNGTAQKLKYNLDLHDQTEYFATAPSTSVEHGQSFTFTITLAEGYTLTEAAKEYINVTIGSTPYASCTIRNLQPGKYQITVKDVKNAGEVTIDAGQIETASYNITWPSSVTGYTISDVTVGEDGKESTSEVQTAKYNEKVEFKVNLNEGYTKSQYVVYINRTPQAKKSDGVYSFEVKGETTIEIEQVEKDTLVFTVQPSAGYTQSGNSNLTAKYGESLIFEVTLEEGYKFGNEVKIKIDDGEEKSVQPQNIVGTNRYQITLSRVTENGEISFTEGSVQKKQLEVKDFYNDAEDGDNNQTYHYKFTQTLKKVEYGARVSVYVSALSGWKIQKVELVNDKEVVQQELSKGSGYLWQTTAAVTEAYKVKVTCEPITINLTLTHIGKSNIKTSYNVEADKESGFLKQDEETGTWYLVLPETPERVGYKFTEWNVTGAKKNENALSEVPGEKYEITSGNDMNITVEGKWEYDEKTLFVLDLSSSYDEDSQTVTWLTNIHLETGVDVNDKAELKDLLSKWSENGLEVLKVGVVYSQSFFSVEDVLSEVKEEKDTLTNGQKVFSYTTSEESGWNLENDTYTQRFGSTQKDANRWCASFIKVKIGDQILWCFSNVVQMKK